MEWNSWKWIWTMEYDANHRYIQRYIQRKNDTKNDTKVKTFNKTTNVSSLISEDRYMAIVTQLHRY